MEWVDAVEDTSGWRDVNDEISQPMPCYSVGYVLRCDAKVIALASTLGGTGENASECFGRVTIPRPWAGKVEILQRAGA